MYKRALQREINWREERDTLKANAWLRSEGIAHNGIKHHRELLTAKELDTLTRYLKSTENRQTRSRIKASRTHEVMNIGNRINRQLFRQLSQDRQRQ